MPLEVHPVQESDFPDFVRIHLSAFSTGMASKLTPRPITPEIVKKQVENHIKSFRTHPDVQYLKVIDTDLGGKMIAGAKWRINEKERTAEEIKVQLPVPGVDEQGNQAAQDFMNYLYRVRLEFMGTRPFYFLHLLVTDPDHQRRGAGRLLVKWGIERADKSQLPSFLEGSEAGRPLYESLGFKPVHEEVFDAAKYGGQGKETNTAMIRDAVK